MSDLSRREFVKAGATGVVAAGAITALATTEAHAKNNGDSGEHKGNRKKVKTMRFVKTNPLTITIRGFQQNPSPPSVEANGRTTVNGVTTAWVTVCAPNSDEETNRTYCEISFTKTSNPAGTKVIIETGDVGYPFDGTPFNISGLTPGTYTFEARADYETGTTPRVAQLTGVVL